MRGVAEAMRGVACMMTFGCNGVDTVQMLREAEAVETIAKKYPRTNIAIIMLPAEQGQDARQRVRLLRGAGEGGKAPGDDPDGREQNVPVPDGRDADRPREKISDDLRVHQRGVGRC